MEGGSAFFPPMHFVFWGFDSDGVCLPGDCLLLDDEG